MTPREACLAQNGFTKRYNPITLRVETIQVSTGLVVRRETPLVRIRGGKI